MVAWRGFAVHDCIVGPYDKFLSMYIAYIQGICQEVASVLLLMLHTL